MVEEINPNVTKAMMRDVGDFLLSKAQDNIIEMGISDRGFLLGSGNVIEEAGEIFVEFDAEHAAPVNDGSNAHSVSQEGQDAIRAWVERKLSVPKNEVEKVAQAIVWKIRKKGQEPKPFFDNAIEFTKIKYKGTIDLR